MNVEVMTEAKLEVRAADAVEVRRVGLSSEPAADDATADADDVDEGANMDT